MNFIVEFLPKKASGALTYVVRDPKGFPVGVFDSLQEATLFMDNEYHRIMADFEKTQKHSADA